MSIDKNVRMAEIVEFCDRLDSITLPTATSLTTVNDALAELDYIAMTLARLGLTKSEAAKTEVLGELEFYLQAEKEEEQTLSGAYRNELGSGFGKLRETVRQEMEDSFVFPVFATAPIQDFGVEQKLDPSLPAEIYDHLKEANRCWRTGFSLAALMMTFTAVELVTKFYYEGVTGHPPPRRVRGWGGLANALANRELNCPSSTISALKRVISEYRNRAIHNGLTLDIGQARMIYGVCARVSREMLDDVPKHGIVKQPPNEQDIQKIVMALDPIVGQGDLHCFVHILCGQSLQRICNAGWDRLPDYGIFSNLSLQIVSYKVEYCRQAGLLTYNERLLLCYSTDAQVQYATELWIGRLMQWFNKWIEEKPVSINWDHLEKVSPRAKMAVLNLIEDHGILELEPVLQAWSPYESNSIRDKIDKILAAFSGKEIAA